MELTKSQISELFSMFLSSGGSFNTLIEAMLNTLSLNERSLFIESYDGEQSIAFALVNGSLKVFELRIPRTRSGAFRLMILGLTLRTLQHF